MQNNKLDIIGKKIHSHKSVIAMYAKYCIDEFKDMDLDAIQALICDFDKNKPVIDGINNEININGKIIFDTAFKMKDPTREQRFINVDLELQATENLGYIIENRTIYYDSAMVVVQKNTSFVHSEYDNIDKVYSIFVILKPRKDIEGNVRIIDRTISDLLVTKDGSKVLNKQKMNLDKIIIIRMKDDYIHPLLQMIHDLFIKQHTKETLLPTLAKYDIIGLEEEEVENMCNLHEFYIEQGKELGIEKGIVKERTNTIRLLMSQLDKSFEEVYAFCKYDENEIETYRKLINNE